jgi:PAS domain S-box-containing protein
MHPWRKYLNLREWPLTAFIVIAVLIGNALALTYYVSYKEIRERDKWVDFTQDNIAAVLQFSTALQEALVAQHSYLSLGRQDYRETAQKKLGELPDKLTPLLERIDNADVQSALAEMGYEVEALLKMSAQFMRARARGDLAAAFDPKLSESFFQLADHIQQNADLLRDHERALLEARLHRAQKSQNYYISMMLLASLVSLAVVVVVSLLLLKSRSRTYAVEDELRETRERLDLAIKGTSDGLWDWNPQTNELYLSPRLREMYGYSPQELPSTVEAFQAIIYPEDLGEALALAHRYLAREVPRYEYIMRVRHKDGSWRWVMSRGTAIWSRTGAATRMVGVHTDITSLKRMEEELREAKGRADRANRTKTTFLANMSHEIRTPMNAIIGIAEILRRKIPASAVQREYVDALSIASRSLFALINDLLDLSKLDNGSLQLEQVPFDIHAMLTEAVTLDRVRADEKGIALDLQIAPKLPVMLVGDPTRLRQIITNLLSNAVKFTEQGGVTMHAGVTPIGHIELRVKDTGIGIPASARKTIFEKFTQSDPSITRRFGGTGLGLSICRELCELMGGEIDLISHEGKGSEFIVTLPLPAATMPVEDPTAGPSTVARTLHFARGHVLLVEDYKPNILVVRTVLSSLGFGCEAVSTGSAARDLLLSPKHDGFVAVLMDVQLPDISGVDVTRLIRNHEADHQLHHLPIIAMTAHAMMGDREKFIAAGMDAYIAKPFDPDDLADKLIALALPSPEPSKEPAA